MPVQQLFFIAAVPTMVCPVLSAIITPLYRMEHGSQRDAVASPAIAMV